MFEIKEKIKDTDKFILKNFDLDSNQSQETIISMVSLNKFIFGYILHQEEIFRSKFQKKIF